MDKEKDIKLDIIESHFGTDYKTTTGNEIRFDCPFCLEFRGKSDGDYKFYVNTQTLTYNCFKCKAQGRLRLDNVTASLLKASGDIYNELIEFLENTSKDYSEEKDQKLYKIPTKSALARESARKYLIEERKLTEEEVRFYNIRLGTIGTGFFGRVVIPNVVHKSIWTDMYVSRTYIDKGAKYLNPSASESGGAVFNLHNIKEEPDEIIITEGVFSAISAGKNAVAVYGKHVTNSQIKKIINKKPKRIYECLDSDAKKEGLKLCKRIKELYNCEMYRIPLPEDKDPNDLGREKFREILENESTEFVSDVYYMLLELDL